MNTMTKELELMTPEELSMMSLTSLDAETIYGRKLTQEEAKTLHDMIHQTERVKKTFTLNDVEYANAVKFAEKHAKCISKSAIGERFEYVFIPGGIGTVKVIKCLICGIEENITDFDHW